MKNKYSLLWLLLLALGLATPRPGRAQGSYRPGYIVRPSGDTVRGEVLLRGALRSSTACSFRPAATAAATEYRPTELRAYGLAGQGLYETRRVPTHRSATDTTTSALFLHLLARGRARLYARRDQSDQTHFYLAMPADTLQELRQYQVQRAGGAGALGQYAYETLSPFRNVLARSFHDCLAVQPLLPQLPLDEGSLAKVVNRYNACVGDASPLPQFAQSRARVSLGVVGGAEYSNVNFTDILRAHEGNFAAFSGPVLGGFVALPLTSLNRHLALRFDVLYERLHYDATYVSIRNTTVPITQQATITLHYLRLPLQMRYYLLDGKLSPFLLAGLSANALLRYDSFLRSSYPVGGSTQVFEGPAFAPEDTSGLEVAFLGGLGLQASGPGGHPLSLEVRAEKGSGFLAQGLSSPVLRVGALLSISLTRQ